MADLDELQIKITSSSKDAEEAIDKLVKSLKGLNTAIGSLDASKVNSFASAMSKLANIGANTNTTSKAIKGMAGDIASAFGIRTKKGIDDIVASLEALYKATRNVNLNGSAENNNIYANSQKNLQDAIEANYEYKEAIDETTKSIAKYVKAQNKSGQKIAMAAMAEEYGEDFRNLTKVLGKSFNNKLKASEGATDLAKFFEDMNSALNTDFKTGNMQELKESVDMLVVSLQNAKEKTYDFRTAISSGLISGEEAAESVMNISDKIWALIKEQDKYGASSGLGGLVDVFKQISNVQVPDLSSLEKLNNIDVSKVASQVSNIGTSATRSQQEVENLVASLSKVETVIEGNEIKNYERGFTMKDVAPIKNVEFPPALYEQVDFFQEKMLPAIIDTENEIENLLMHMMAMSSVEPIYDAITEKFIEWKTQLMEMNGAISGDKWIVPEFKGNADFNRQQVGWISDIKPEVVEGYWYDIENAANKCLPAIVNVGEATLTTADHLKKLGESFEDVSKSSDDFNSFFDNVNESTNNIKESYEEIKSSIENILESIRNYKQVISDMESGKTAFDKTQYDEAVRGYSEATNALKNYKNELLGVEKEEQKAGKVNIFGDVLSSLIALSHELKNISAGFGRLADGGIKILKTAFTPLTHVIQEYKEKFDDLRNSIEGFVNSIKVHLKKMSDFWKRSMRTFTFMIVRTAITAIIKEVGNAVQSLAMYSNAMGTAFNTDLSNMVADFQYLGRSIVSVFAPLLNFITPIIDAITDRIATLISYIGMLFAALGGKATFTKAKKNVTNYAESLDSASKSAKNLTMGIDELNIISENKGGGGAKPYDGWEDAWEEVEIPDNIKKLSDKLKDIFKDLFDPIKRAWDKAKDYVLSGWKYMTSQMKKLLADVWRDFIRVWKSDVVEHIFYNLFMIIGDLERVIGNIAKRFDEAWNEGEKGYQIFKNIADIIDILVQHVRNVTEYMVEWSDKLDFNPLLESIVILTDHLKILADFLGGVFEDVMKNVVLEHIRWLTEEGLPHLNKTISEVIDAFDWKKLREDLVPLEIAFENLSKNIETGIVNALGNLAKRVGEFQQSEEFKAFLNTIEHMMNVIDAEDVRKILEGIGIGILRLGESLVKFIGSDSFNAFLDKLDEWMANATPEDIADILEKIAWAIGLFKFAEFATAGLAGFFQFAAIIKSMTDLSSIASDLSAVAGALEATGAGGEIAAAGIGSMSSPALIAAASIAIAALAVYSFIKSFGGIDGAATELKKHLDSVIESAEKFGKAIKLDEEFSNLKDNIGKLSDALGGLKSAWELILGIVEVKFKIHAFLIEGALKILLDRINAFVEKVTFYVEILGGLADVIKGVWQIFTEPDIETGISTMNQGFERIKGAGETAIGNIKSRWIDSAAETVQKVGSYFTDEEATTITAGLLKLPDTVAPTISGTADVIASKQSDAFGNAITSNGVKIAQSNVDMLNNALDSTQNANYAGAASVFASQQEQELIASIFGSEASLTSNELLVLNNMLGAAESADYAQYSAIVASKQQESINNGILASGALLKTENLNMINSTLGAVDDADYQSKAETLAEKWHTFLYGSIDEKDYADIGTLLNTKPADAMKENSQFFDDANIETSEKGAQQFSQTYLEWFSSDKGNLKQGLTTVGSDTATSLVEGLNQGLEANMSSSQESINKWFTMLNTAIHDNPIMPFGSPNKKTKEYGEDIVKGFIEGIEAITNGGTVGMAVINLFTKVTTVMSEQMDILKNNIRTKLTEIMNFSDFDVTTPISNLFTQITTVVESQMNTLGEYVNGTLLPMFMETYITPFFSIDMWQPLFDTLLNEVFVTAFTTFCEWFNEQMTIWWDEYLVVWFTVEKWNELFDPLHKIFEQRYKTFIDWWVKAMKSWWEEKTMPYFKPEFWNEKVFNPLEKNRLDHHRKFIEWWDKALKSWWDENTMPYFKKEFWDEQIFTPLRENIQDHFKKFVEWWDDSMKSWWEGHVVPYFDEDLWKKLFNYVFLAADEVFTKVREKITERISEACEAVADGCNDMCESLQKVLDLIGEVMSALQGFGELGGSVTFNYSGEFATGGFPSAGSLFLAGETGAGAELVGNVGGKTGVVSNDEITGIAEAVYETGSQESVLLAQLIGLTKQLLDKEPVILGDKEIAEMANNGQSQLGMNIIS